MKMFRILYIELKLILYRMDVEGMKSSVRGKAKSDYNFKYIYIYSDKLWLH